MKKTIVIFSNPFGYGPTGNAIPILKSFLEKTKGIDFVFAGSGLCMEIVSDIPVKKVYLDERNEEQIAEYLNTLGNPFVIGLQNRFCIKVAKRLQIPCSFVDVLAWFWKVIPPDHLLADEIFWIKFPGIEKKIPKSQKNIHLVASVISTLPTVASKDRRLIIHIGGAKYPPLNEVPTHYLNLIAKAVNAFKTDGSYDSVIVAGGSDAVNYLKQRVINKKVLPVSLPKDKFIQEISHATHVMTIAGVSSTLESFSLNIPTSFLLPLNLSQVALLDVLLENSSAPSYLDWHNYAKVSERLNGMSEKDAIAEIKKYAEILDGDEELSRKFVDDFIKMSEQIPSKLEQTRLIKFMGNSGADEIVDILVRRWGLTEITK